MLYLLHMMGPPPEELGFIFMILGIVFGDILLLKLGLIMTKAEVRRKFKWVVYSFFIQFGMIFFIGSPLMILGFIGAFRGDPAAIIAVSILGLFIDINIINILHKIGLKRALIVGLLIVAPMIFAMSMLGSYLSSLSNPF